MAESQKQDEIKQSDSSSSVSAHYERGNTLCDLEQYEEALAAYNIALAIDPKDARIHYNCGVVLCALERYEEALKAYGIALTITQGAHIYFNRGLIFYIFKQYEAALKDYNAALAIDPKDARIHFNRGNVLKALNQRTKAINAYLNALAINENLPDLQNQFQQITGIDYKKYKDKMLKELNVKLASIAGEFGMFKRDEKEADAIKMKSQDERAQLLNIILDYSVCPLEAEESENPEAEKSENPEAKFFCCVS